MRTHHWEAVNRIMLLRRDFVWWTAYGAHIYQYNRPYGLTSIALNVIFIFLINNIIA